MAPNTHTQKGAGTPVCSQDEPLCSQLIVQKCFAIFSLPPDLKIAGNSIFILLSKNFFLTYRAPLPNFRTSRGVPALSSPALWVAATMGENTVPTVRL